MAHATYGKFVSEYDIQNINQKQRLELLRTLESVGLRSVGELGDMVDSDRCKWLFWNLHENFDAIRLMEPTLQARITSMQFTIQDNLTLHGADIVDKRLDFSCTWHLQLTYPGCQDEIDHAIGSGWINLAIAQALPPYPFLGQGQKAFLDADHTVYPSQLFLDGWISEQVWHELRSHFGTANPTCRTDVVLQDNGLFPVKSLFDFVRGPPGAIGVMNMEFRAFSHPTERRLHRRSEPRQRS